MKHICVTHIDSVTGVLCTESPVRNGPVFPLLSGFVFKWSNQSTWPVSCTPEGAYITAPKHYGTCDDDADITCVGFLEVLTEAIWNERKQIEIEARRPSELTSWVWNEIEQLWKPPFTRPDDAIINGGTIRYQWDESVVNWVSI